MAAVVPAQNMRKMTTKTILDRATTKFSLNLGREDRYRVSSDISETTDSETDAKKSSRRAINPNGMFAIIWASWIMLLIMYGMFMVPMRVAFRVGVDPSSSSLLIDMLIDCFFLIDIVVQFHMGYKSNSEERLVFDLGKIRRRYLKTWFVIDMISAIPFDLILFVTARGESFVFTKLFKTFRLMRVAKLIKISKLRSLLENAELRSWYILSNPGVRRMLQTVILVVLLSHWTSAVWFFVSSAAVEDGDEDAWVLNPATKDAYESEDTWKLYVASMYWAVSTLTSVGFGDFAPQNNAERIVATFACWLGATVFGYVIGQMSSIVADLNQASFQFHRKMDSINSYLKYRKVPQQLQRRIRKFYRYYIRRKMIFDEKQILNDLTHGLKLELSMFLTKDVLKEIHIFRNIDDPAFMSAIVTMLKPFSAAPGDYIFREGDIAAEMYLIVRGTVEVVSSDGVVYSQLSGGHHFGEVSSFEEKVEERRASSARAITYCDLFSFSKADLAEVTHNFPEVHEQIRSTTESRMAAAKNLKTHKKARKVATGTKKNLYVKMPENPTGTNVLPMSQRSPSHGAGDFSPVSHGTRSGSVPNYAALLPIRKADNPVQPQNQEPLQESHIHQSSTQRRHVDGDESILLRTGTGSSSYQTGRQDSPSSARSDSPVLGLSLKPLKLNGSWRDRRSNSGSSSSSLPGSPSSPLMEFHRDSSFSSMETELSALQKKIDLQNLEIAKLLEALSSSKE